MPVLISLGAIVAAFLVGALFLVAIGASPLEAYGVLFTRGLGSRFGVTETLIKMAPLLTVSAGLLIALKAGVWNIGVDGQFLVGALLAAVSGASLAGVVPTSVMLAVAVLFGAVGGFLWGVIPALLKLRYGLNEIITTIMMNYVAIYLTSWLVKGPFKDPSVVPPQTALIARAFRLPAIPFTRVHVGFLLGVLAIFLVAFLFRHTTLGFKFWVLGQNPRAALHAGMQAGRLAALALLLSAGFAGLAGANDVLGVKGLFQGEWNPAYGLTAFALVFLARLDSLLVVPFAYFFSFLLFGGEMMARTAGVPSYFVEMLEGLMLLFFAAGLFVERSYRHRRAALAVAPGGS